MTSPVHASALWYQNRASKCDYWKVSADGKRRTRCERYAKHGTSRCPSHGGNYRELTAQEATTMIALFFSLVCR